MAANGNTTTLKDYETNYFRLVRLTMIEGTKAIEQTVTGRLPGRQTLHAILQQKEDKIRSLKSGNSFVFNTRQLAILYPATGNCILSNIDMTLWCALARKLASVPKRATINWDEAPLPGQEDWYHDIVRIRQTRNILCHLHRPELDHETFKDLWNYVSGALRRLNPNVDFEEYRNAEYDRAAAREFEIQVKEQVLQEMNDVLKAGLAERRHVVVVIVVIGVLILALIAVTATTVYFQLRKETTCGYGKRSEEIAPFGTLTFMPREGWKARPPSGPLKPLAIPVEIVEYTHTTDVTQCTDCCSQVYNIQYLHMHYKDCADIGLHYLIDSSGLVYEGRSHDKVPAAVHDWNEKIISIALIGNFMQETPAVYALSAFDMLIQYLLQKRLVVSNFSLYAMCELVNTDSPGRNLFEAVNKNTGGYKNFKHVAHRPEGKCIFDTIQRNSTTLQGNSTTL